MRKLAETKKRKLKGLKITISNAYPGLVIVLFPINKNEKKSRLIGPQVEYIERC